MSKGEKIVLALTAIALCAAAVFLALDARGSGRYSISALPEEAAAVVLRESVQPPPASAETAEKLDLNTASAEELARLPGIGEVRAAEIVRYREENGLFAYPEDVMEVYGIGEGIYNEIREYVTAQ